MFTSTSGRVFLSCYLHQKYVNTCTLNGDSDSFGVTDHKAEERLVSTAEKTSVGSIQNCENEPILEETSVSEAGNTTDLPVAPLAREVLAKRLSFATRKIGYRK